MECGGLPAGRQAQRRYTFSTLSLPAARPLLFHGLLDAWASMNVLEKNPSCATNETHCVSRNAQSGETIMKKAHVLDGQQLARRMHLSFA
jgi:hypothetical protein